jgi:hypothetical protein
MQLHMSEEQHLVEALLGHSIAVGVDPRGLAVLGIIPHLDNLAAGHRRLVAGQHDDGDDDSDQHGRDDAREDHVTAALGELFAESGVVNLFLGFLME